MKKIWYIIKILFTGIDYRICKCKSAVRPGFDVYNIEKRIGIWPFWFYEDSTYALDEAYRRVKETIAKKDGEVMMHISRRWHDN